MCHALDLASISNLIDGTVIVFSHSTITVMTKSYANRKSVSSYRYVFEALLCVHEVENCSLHILAYSFCLSDVTGTIANGGYDEGKRHMTYGFCHTSMARLGLSGQVL